MKNKFFNTIMTIALIIIIYSSISFSQSNDNPNNNMNMDNTAMTDSCKMMMGKMKDHMKMNKAMMDSCKMMMGKMKDHKKMDSAMMDSCKMMMKSPEHKKMMDKMKDHKKMDMTDSSKTMMMKNHKHKMMMGKMKSSMKTKMKNKNSMVRKGIIDLKSIDKNKDGFVYQDRMDWNVISDNPGTCPLCGMKLKKYSIEQASKNLNEHGFKVKN